MTDTTMTSLQFHIVDNFFDQRLHGFTQIFKIRLSDILKNSCISISKALNFKFSLRLSFLTLWITFSDCYAAKPPILKHLLKTLDINNPACIKLKNSILWITFSPQTIAKMPV